MIWHRKKILFFGALALYYYHRIHSCYSLFIFFFLLFIVFFFFSFVISFTQFSIVVLFFLGCFSLFFFIDSLKPIKNKYFLFFYSLRSLFCCSSDAIFERFLLFERTHIHTHSMCFIRLGYVGFFSCCAQSVVIYRSADAHISLCSIVIQNEWIVFTGSIKNGKKRNRKQKKQIEISSVVRA